MAEATPHSNSMNVDTIFEVLSNEYRRIILTQLLEQQSPITMGELVDSVAEAEANSHAPRDDLRKRVRAILHHNHLPKLVNSDMVDYDTERGLISVREAAYEVEPYLALAKRSDRES